MDASQAQQLLKDYHLPLGRISTCLLLILGAAAVMLHALRPLNVADLIVTSFFLLLSCSAISSFMVRITPQMLELHRVYGRRDLQATLEHLCKDIVAPVVVLKGLHFPPGRHSLVKTVLGDRKVTQLDSPGGLGWLVDASQWPYRERQLAPSDSAELESLFADGLTKWPSLPEPSLGKDGSRYVLYLVSKEAVEKLDFTTFHLFNLTKEHPLAQTLSFLKEEPLRLSPASATDT